MFYSLTGNIMTTEKGVIIVDCSGVGFRLYVSMNTLKKSGKIGDKITLYTYLSVSENSLDLFGFYDLDELSCFKSLISISGVGPKAALSVLSELTPAQMTKAVSGGDVKAFTRAQGVGPKLAQRIMLELKGRLSFFGSEEGSDENTFTPAENKNFDEALSALQFLGYNRYDALEALKTLDKTLSTEDLIKKSLPILSKNI